MFFGMLLVMGTRNGFGVFVSNWEEEWGVTTGDISIAAAIGWIVNGFSQPILGKIVDRYGGRVVVVISMIVLGSLIPTVGIHRRRHHARSTLRRRHIVLRRRCLARNIRSCNNPMVPTQTRYGDERRRRRRIARRIGNGAVPDSVDARHQLADRVGSLRHPGTRTRPARFHRDTAQTRLTIWDCCQTEKPAPKTTQPPHSSESERRQ